VVDSPILQKKSNGADAVAGATSAVLRRRGLRGRDPLPPPPPTTPASTPSPASTSASAEAATPAPSPSPAAFARRTGLVDDNVAAHEIVAVKSLNGALGFFVAVNFDKTEPAWLA
jgi:hypothetical protein